MIATTEQSRLETLKLIIKVVGLIRTPQSRSLTQPFLKAYDVENAVALHENAVKSKTSMRNLRA